jgi:hypothetical protein
MKNFVLLCCLAMTLTACSTVQPVTQQTSCNDTGLTLQQKDELGQRGCCSYHQGVCGCQYGRVVCCDDTYSPSCTCKTDDKPVEIK